jgi:hypothetical protein
MNRRTAASTTLVALVSILVIAVATVGVAVATMRPDSGVATTLASSSAQVSTQSSTTTSGALQTQTSNPTTTSEPEVTSTTSTIRTCTDIPAISYMYCGGTLRISAVGTPGAGPGVQSTGGSWNFTATISSNSVPSGQSILLWANLTNIGPSVTFSEFARPYINPEVYAANGTEVWAWNPPQSTWPNWNITSGETTSQDVSIPTSQLVAGQSYFVTVAPISVQFPTPNNLTFTFQFSVTPASSGTSTVSDQCYPGAPPTNSSTSAIQSTFSRAVLNVTQEFNSWNWTPLASFMAGSYTLNLAGSQNSQTTTYLEPQVFISATNGQGQTQKMDVTNLGNWNGQGWPPDLSGSPNVLFGGNVTIQRLFACDNYSVYLEVTTYGA